MPFDVGCARCGHDLRGLIEPICPACGLEFDWAVAVPIEQLTCLHCGYHLYGLRDPRCPECGERFTWEEALDDYRRRQKPLFEYRWRREPLRSLARTWAWTLFPWKFWSKLDIHDPVRVGPLLVIVALAVLVFGGSLIVFGGLEEWLRYWLRWRSRAPVGLSALPRLIFLRLGTDEVHAAFMALVQWFAASLAALMIFRQSMRRCRVRTVHVVRVWAYALPTMAPVVALGLSAITCCAAAWDPGVYFVPRPALVALFLIAFATWSIHLGYKKYLHMPHSAAVAVASQVIAVLVGGLCEIFLPPNVRDSIFIRILDLFGLW